MKHEATDEMMMPDSAFRKKKLPDVYLIVAAEYAGIKNLADVCGFDDSPFTILFGCEVFSWLPIAGAIIIIRRIPLLLY